jgi:hypothetical protein
MPAGPSVRLSNASFAVGFLGRVLRHAALVGRRVQVAWSLFSPTIFARSGPFFPSVIGVATHL